MSKARAYINWSGGKDAAFALYKLLQEGHYNVTQLLTSVNAVHDRISMHGVRRRLLNAQASAIGLPITTIELPEQPKMPEYEMAMRDKLAELKKNGYSHAVFGDIFLEDLRAYREEKLGTMGMKCVFPLWKIDTKTLVHEFLALGFKSIVVCVNEQYLDASFCGRLIDQDFINDLPATVDPCGENGEFHSFVYDGPIFHKPVSFTKGDVVRKTYPAPAGSNVPDYGFWFCDLLPS